MGNRASQTCRMTIPVVLASASPARAMLLRAAGVAFTVAPSSVDEDELTASLGESAATTDIVRLLAEAKAQAISAQTPAPALVIGCDSMLEFEGKSYGKPGDAASAIARWQQMRGRRGVLHTGHHVICLRNESGAAQPRSAHEVVSTEVEFADVSDAEIHAYVATGEPLQVAGAFTLDSLGSAFITGVTGDHANVVGLSIAALRRLTARLDLTWTDLWSALPETQGSAHKSAGL